MFLTFTWQRTHSSAVKDGMSTRTTRPLRPWQQLLDGRVSRRQVIRGGLSAAGAAAVPLLLRGAGHDTARAAAALRDGAHPFVPIKPSSNDELLLPAGFWAARDGSAVANPFALAHEWAKASRRALRAPALLSNQ
jgi:hypothetical protein